MIDWKTVRNDFPVTRDCVYLMSAAMSPIPSPVFKRVAREYRTINEAGDIFWEEDVHTYRRLTERLAAMIGAGASDVTFVANTSTAMSLLALSLKGGRPGRFNVVSMADEFPATTVPFEYQGIEMRYARPADGRYQIDSIMNLMDSETLAIVTSYVQYGTGFRQDLKALGAELRKKDVLFIVNATQGFPVFPLDVEAMNIDAFSASLHKWGFAGHVGALFFTSQKFRRRFRSPLAGWLSVEPKKGEFIHTAKNEPFALHKSADRYMFGTINFQAINTIHAALDYLEAIGAANIAERIHGLNDRLIAGLEKLDARIVTPVERREERSGILSFNVGVRTAELATYLTKRKIFTSFRNGNIRCAVNIFNDESDVDRLLSAIGEF